MQVKLSIFTLALDQTIIITLVLTITLKLYLASGYIWIGSGYLLANAAAGLIWAKLLDIWGRKPIFLIAIAMFFGSLIIFAEARNIKMVIIGRVLQGIASGGMVQLVMIIIFDIFSIRYASLVRILASLMLMMIRQRSLYFGLLEVVWTVVGSVRPVLGGLLTERLSWR
jgi:MFS family permease